MHGPPRLRVGPLANGAWPAGAYRRRPRACTFRRMVVLRASTDDDALAARLCARRPVRDRARDRRRRHGRPCTSRATCKHDREVALKVLEARARRGPRRRAVPAPRSSVDGESAAPATSCRCSTRGEASGLLYYVMPYVRGRVARATSSIARSSCRSTRRCASRRRWRARSTTRTGSGVDPPRPQAGEHPAPGRAAGASPTSASRSP